MMVEMFFFFNNVATACPDAPPPRMTHEWSGVEYLVAIILVFFGSSFDMIERKIDKSRTRKW